MPSPTLANLQKQRNNANREHRRLMGKIWTYGPNPWSFKPASHPNYGAYMAAYRKVENLNRRLAAKRRENERARQARQTARRHRESHLEKKYFRRWFNIAARPPAEGGTLYKLVAKKQTKRTRNVGTSTSPNRSSPKRRNRGTSP